MTSCSAIHASASGPSTDCGSSAASRENSISSSTRPADSASYRNIKQPYSRDRKSRSRSSACQRATASVNTAGSTTGSGTAQAVCRTASGHGRVTVTAVSSREPGCVATPSMRETAVSAPEILYMNEYAIYNLIWIEIRLKLKLKSTLVSLGGTFTDAACRL